MSKPEKQPQPPDDDPTVDSTEVTPEEDTTTNPDGYGSGVSKKD